MKTNEDIERHLKKSLEDIASKLSRFDGQMSKYVLAVESVSRARGKSVDTKGIPDISECFSFLSSIPDRISSLVKWSGILAKSNNPKYKTAINDVRNIIPILRGLSNNALDDLNTASSKRLPKHLLVLGGNAYNQLRVNVAGAFYSAPRRFILRPMQSSALAVAYTCFTKLTVNDYEWPHVWLALSCTTRGQEAYAQVMMSFRLPGEFSIGTKVATVDDVVGVFNKRIGL